MAQQDSFFLKKWQGEHYYSKNNKNITIVIILLVFMCIEKYLLLVYELNIFFIFRNGSKWIRECGDHNDRKEVRSPVDADGRHCWGVRINVIYLYI